MVFHQPANPQGERDLMKKFKFTLRSGNLNVSGYVYVNNFITILNLYSFVVEWLGFMSKFVSHVLLLQGMFI